MGAGDIARVIPTNIPMQLANRTLEQTASRTRNTVLVYLVISIHLSNCAYLWVWSALHSRLWQDVEPARSDPAGRANPHVQAKMQPIDQLTSALLQTFSERVNPRDAKTQWSIDHLA